MQWDGLASATISYGAGLCCYVAPADAGSANLEAECLISAELSLESPHCSVDINPTSSQLRIHGLREATAKMHDYLPLKVRPGNEVQRMGRSGWRGKITKVDREQVLVNWGSSQEWLHHSEVYPLVFSQQKDDG